MALALPLAFAPGLAAQNPPVDTVPPTIAINAPVGAHLTDTTPQIVVDYADPQGSGISLLGLSIELDGTNLRPFCTATVARAICEPPELPEGPHEIVARVQDRAGNSASARRAFTVDTTPPELGIGSAAIFADGFESGDLSAWGSRPLGDEITNEATSTRLVLFSDSVSGVDPATFTIAVDGLDATAGCTVSLHSALCALPALAEGVHAITIGVADRAGNAAQLVVTFTVDRTPPAFDPAQLLPLACPALTVDLRAPVRACFDDALSGADAATLQLLVDGVDRTAEATVAAGCITWTPAADHASGEHQAMATVADLAGNVGTVDWCFEIASPTLEIAIVSPADGALTNQATINVSGTVDPLAESVSVNGVVATIAGGAFEALAVPLSEGANVLEAIATNSSGGLGAASVAVTRDATPPTFDPAQLSPPQCPTPTTDLRAPVRACFADALSGPDPATLQLTVDGVDRTAASTVEGDCITWTPDADHAPGEHQAMASIADLAGNVGTVDWCYTVASLALDIAITSPADGILTADAAIDIAGTVDVTADDVTVNGVAATVAGGTFEALGVPLLGGLNEIVAIATSAIGGGGSARIVVVQDSEPPVIIAEVVPEANAGGWHDTAVTVSFECSDDLSDIATCPDPVVVTTEGAGQQVSGTAVDGAGNSTGVTVDLDIDLTPPTIAATVDPAVGASGWHSTPVVVTYICDDALSGVVACPPAVTIDGEGADQQIAGTVEDVAGNQTSTVTPLSIDLSPPSFDVAELRPSPCPQRATDVLAPVRACFADLVSGVVEATLQLTVDGVDRTGEASVAGGCMTWTPPVAHGPGEHQAAISAVDVAGNAGTADWCFDVEVPPIGITIDAPAVDTFTRDGAIDVLGTVAEPVDSVTVNGVVATVGAGAYQVLALPLREGRNEITVVARDATGNSGTASVTVFRDTTAPAVRIETPRDGAVLTSLQVDVAGLVNDLIAGTTINADDCTVTINGIEAEVANRSFLASNLLLKRGLNTLTAVARDRLGNTRTHSVEVMVEDRAGQRILLLAGNNQSNPVFEQLPDRLVVALEDANGDAVVGRPVTFEVSRGNGTVGAFPEAGTEVTVLTNELGYASALFTLGGRAGAGNNRVLATAPGFLGEVEFCATATTAFAERVTAIAGDQQRGPVAKKLPQPLVVLVTDIGGNPVAGVDVRFEVLTGGGSFGGLPETVVTTDLDGLAEAVWTLGLEAGVNNNSARATFLGLIESPAAFTASAMRVRPAAGTRLRGVVLDNQDNPVAGVTLQLESAGAPPAPVPSDVSDDQGRFDIAGAPVGAARLIVDGSTTTRPGRWPTLVVDVTTIAGQDNDLTQPIWLLPLADNEILVQNGGPPQDMTLLLPGVDGAEITISASSVSCPEGQTECRISWTQVRGERLPMDPPLGSSFMLAGTFQPSEAHYDPPARLCIPNADQAPGSQVEIFSFDHDIGEFIVVGTATVTPDGAQICSDPGFGLITGGWHGCVPPPPPCTSACGSCPEDGDCFTYTRQCPQCGAGTCDRNNKPDGTAVSNDEPDDCFKEECQGGSPQQVGDPSETPGEDVEDHECKRCSDTGPEADPSKDGTIVDECMICKDGKLEEAMVELSGVPDRMCVGETVQITARVTPDAPGITGPSFESDPELTAVSDGNNQTAQLTGNAPGHAKMRELIAFFGSQPDQCDTKKEELFVLPRNVEGIPGKINRFTEHSFLMAECPDYPMQDRTVNHDIDGCSGGTSQDPMLTGGIFMGGTPRRFNQAPTAFGAAQAPIPFGTAPRNLPCNNHDVCYQTCGSTQVGCDNGMRTDMDAVCATAYPAACPPALTPAECMIYAEERDDCFRYSSRYFRGLRLGGSPAWTQRQTQYCLCCEAP